MLTECPKTVAVQNKELDCSKLRALPQVQEHFSWSKCVWAGNPAVFVQSSLVALLMERKRRFRLERKQVPRMYTFQNIIFHIMDLSFRCNQIVGYLVANRNIYCKTVVVHFYISRKGFPYFHRRKTQMGEDFVPIHFRNWRLPAHNCRLRSQWGSNVCAKSNHLFTDGGELEAFSYLQWLQAHAGEQIPAETAEHLTHSKS